MIKTSFNATVVNGGLKLDEPLELSENSRVHVTVVPVLQTRQQWLQSLDALEELQRSRPISSGGTKFSRDELHERG